MSYSILSQRNQSDIGDGQQWHHGQCIYPKGRSDGGGPPAKARKTTDDDVLRTSPWDQCEQLRVVRELRAVSFVVLLSDTDSVLFGG